MVLNEKIFVLADNDIASSEEIKRILNKNNYIVAAQVEDGMDAVIECTKNSADVVIVKDDLPLLNGYAVSAHLRKNGFEGVILIITESYSPEIAEQAKRFGADGYIVKPVEERFLIPWLHTAFVRITDTKELSEKKKMLLSELEEKRLAEAAVGKIASSLGITIREANEIFEKKAAAGGKTKSDLAKIILSDM